MLIAHVSENTVPSFCVTSPHHFSDHDEFGTKLSVDREYLQWSDNKHDDIQGENDPSSFIRGIKKSQYCSHHKGEEREGVHQIPRVTKVHTEFVNKILGLLGSQLRNKQKVPKLTNKHLHNAHEGPSPGLGLKDSEHHSWRMY